MLPILLGSHSLWGDVIHLKDGTQLEGIVKHTDDGWVIHTNGKQIHVPVTDVDSIELSPATRASPQAAIERLASLRRSVEGLGDLTEITARFQRFVDQSTDATATAEAKKDLVVWQERSRLKMVKVGSEWVTSDQRDKLIEHAESVAETARQLMKQGRTKEAEPLLQDVLKTDPTNATALYLTGVLRLQQDQLTASRKAFEAASAIIPNHAPTLNNLGIVQWRQHEYIPSLQCFDAAMLAKPVDRTIVDNVAVALQNLPIDLQKSPVTLKLLRHFNEQDQKLSEQMAQVGMRRLGSLWVSDHDLAQMKADEKLVQDKLDALSGEFDKTRERADTLSENIESNQAEMSRIEASSFVTDQVTGIRVAMPYPSTYYDLQREAQRMVRDRDAETAKLDAIKKQAQDLQNRRPTAKNQGVMQPIGAEGTPIKINALVGK